MGFFKKIFKKEDMDDLVEEAQKPSKSDILDEQIRQQSYSYQQESEIAEKKKQLAELKQKRYNISSRKQVIDKFKSIGAKINNQSSPKRTSTYSALQRSGVGQSQGSRQQEAFLRQPGQSFGSGLAIDRASQGAYQPAFLVDVPTGKSKFKQPNYSYKSPFKKMI